MERNRDRRVGRHRRRRGNHYFPADAIQSEHFEPTSTTTVRPWRGTASYYTVVVEGARNGDAAWRCPETGDAAKNVESRVAFWPGAEVR